MYIYHSIYLPLSQINVSFFILYPPCLRPEPEHCKEKQVSSTTN